jgi:hypothetical protein
MKIFTSQGNHSNWTFLVLLLLFSVFAELQAQTQVGADIEGEAANDNSGGSINISSDGSRVAIGAINNDGAIAGVNSGHTRVYDLVGGTWTQVGSDIDGAVWYNLSGYSVSLSSDGSRLAVGTPDNNGDGVGAWAGQVRVYD